MGRLIENGYLTPAHLRSGAPIRIHWSVPLGFFLLGGGRLVPGFWAGALLVVLVHELGHAFLVWQSGAFIDSIEVLPFGGLCRWGGRVPPRRRAAIAWGGVLAQAAVLLVAFALVGLLGRPSGAMSDQFVDALTRGNLWLIGLNLLPVPPLDGHKAWPLLGMLLRARRRERARRQQRRDAQQREQRRAELVRAIRHTDEVEDGLDEMQVARIDAAVATVLRLPLSQPAAPEASLEAPAAHDPHRGSDPKPE